MADENKNTNMPWNEQGNTQDSATTQQPASTTTETTETASKDVTFTPRPYEPANEPEKRTTYEDLYTALHPEPATYQDSPKARRRERANRTIAALSDAISTMGNIWATSKGGPNMAGDGKDTMSKAYDDMYAAQNARRVKAQDEWLKGYETAIGKDEKQYNTDMSNYFKKSNLIEAMRGNDIALEQAGKTEARAEAKEKREEETHETNQRIGAARAEQIETQNKYAPRIAESKIRNLDSGTRAHDRSNRGGSHSSGSSRRSLRFGNTVVDESAWNKNSNIDYIYSSLPTSVTRDPKFRKAAKGSGFGMTIRTSNKRVAIGHALAGDYGTKVQTATERVVRGYGK